MKWAGLSGTHRTEDFICVKKAGVTGKFERQKCLKMVLLIIKDHNSMI